MSTSQSPEESPWIEPPPPADDALTRYQRRTGPSFRAAWLKIGVMVAALVTLLSFHDRMTSKAAGCFQQSTGLEEQAPPKETPEIRMQLPAPAP